MAKSNRISPAQLRAMAPRVARARAKFGNVKADGFDSKLERDHYNKLLLREKAGEIHGLERQKPFVLQDKFRTADGEAIRAITYIADFYYFDKDGREYVDDAKGFLAQHSAIKVKMFKNRYRDIKFTLVKK